MVLATTKLLKGTSAGIAMGADAVSRYLSPDQRSALVAKLAADAAAHGAALIDDARAMAAAIVRQAEESADAVRAAAHAEGFATGRAEGMAAGIAEAEPVAELLRRAVDEAAMARATLLAGVEEQAVTLALAVARRVVGMAAQSHTALATSLVRQGLRAACGEVLRVRVHPDDAEPVMAALHLDASEVPVLSDATIAVGGCMIDLLEGTIDLRLETQMESITRALSDQDTSALI